MEPKGHPKAKETPQGFAKCHKDVKKHVQTARGRVLAECDVDPAAGSRDEPTRLPVEFQSRV